MMRRAPGLRGNFQLAYGTPYWTSKGAPMGSLVARRRPMGALVRAGFRGLGDDSTSVDLCALYPEGCVTSQSGGDASSSSGGINWSAVTNVGSALTKDFTSIYTAIQPVPNGCVKMTAANGQSYTSCGQSNVSLPNLSFGSMSTGELLLLLGGGAVVVLLLARGGK